MEGFRSSPYPDETCPFSPLDGFGILPVAFGRVVKFIDLLSESS